jgi:hypothetical protein
MISKSCTHLSPFALALALLSPVACDKSAEPAKTDDKAAAKEAPAPAAKDPKELFTAKVPELPGPLAKLKFGMTEEEIKKAAPEVEAYGKSKEFKDTYLGYYVPDDKKALQSVRVVVEGDGVSLEKILVAAWGEPKRGTALGNPKLFWFNPEKEIRATIDTGYGKQNEVQFEPYLPAKKLLGEGKEKLGIETTPLLGATPEDLQKNYAQYLEVMTKEQAEEQRKRIEKMAGQNLDALGAAGASTNLDLPPTEFGSSFTRINPTIEGGKIVRFSVGIPFEPFPPAKDEILALLKAKWGDPKEQEEYGRKQWLFNPAAPKVIVEADDISNEWDIEVSP